jgi:hypothetical protein
MTWRAISARPWRGLELRRRSRGSSAALLSRLAGLSAFPSGSPPAAAAESSTSSLTSSPSSAVAARGGPAARLAETCVALTAWLTPLVERLVELRESLGSAVGAPMVGPAMVGGKGSLRAMLCALLRPVWASEAGAYTHPLLGRA